MPRERLHAKTRDTLILTREPIEVLQLEADVCLTELTPERGGSINVRWWELRAGVPTVTDHERAQPGSAEHTFWTTLVTRIKARQIIKRATGGAT
jgi:hypothetical protein